jgi:hypothetical protein
VKRLLLATVLLTLIGAAPAAACSADSRATSLHDRLVKADGAFVGKLVKHKRDLFVYRVAVRVKGKLGHRVRVHGLPGCGPSGKKGRRTGLLLDRRHGHWEADAFSEVKPGDLLKAAGIGP